MPGGEARSGGGERGAAFGDFGGRADGPVLAQEHFRLRGGVGGGGEESGEEEAAVGAWKISSAKENSSVVEIRGATHGDGGVSDGASEVCPTQALGESFRQRGISNVDLSMERKKRHRAPRARSHEPEINIAIGDGFCV